MLAEGVTLEEFEIRTDKFNVHSLWEWKDYKVFICELPLKPHEICISAISKKIYGCCRPVKHNASILGLGATGRHKLFYSTISWRQTNNSFLKELMLIILEKQQMHHFVQ